MAARAPMKMKVNQLQAAHHAAQQVVVGQHQMRRLAVYIGHHHAVDVGQQSAVGYVIIRAFNIRAQTKHMTMVIPVRIGRLDVRLLPIALRMTD